MELSDMIGLVLPATAAVVLLSIPNIKRRPLECAVVSGAGVLLTLAAASLYIVSRII